LAQQRNLKLQSGALLAHEAMKMAYSPYSKFKVGCCIETSDGLFFTGCNIENASYSATLCAERTAFSKAVSVGHLKFKKVWLSSSSPEVITPCGVCLQFMGEFLAPQTEIVCSNKNGKKKRTFKFKDLLPQTFIKSDIK
jgi:cytidine deaminase